MWKWLTGLFVREPILSVRKLTPEELALLNEVDIELYGSREEAIRVGWRHDDEVRRLLKVGWSGERDGRGFPVVSSATWAAVEAYVAEVGDSHLAARVDSLIFAWKLFNFCC